MNDCKPLISGDDVETDSVPVEQQTSSGAEPINRPSTDASPLIPTDDDVSVVDDAGPPARQVSSASEPSKPLDYFDWRPFSVYLPVELKVECADVLIIYDDAYSEDAKRMKEEIDGMIITDDGRKAKAVLIEDAVCYGTSHIDGLDEALNLHTFVFAFCTYPISVDPLYEYRKRASYWASVIGTHKKKDCFIPVLLDDESHGRLPPYLQLINPICVYRNTWKKGVVRLLRGRIKQRLDKERKYDEKRKQYLIAKGHWRPLANLGNSSDFQDIGVNRGEDTCFPSVCDSVVASPYGVDNVVSTCESGRRSPDGNVGCSESRNVYASKEKPANEESANNVAKPGSAHVMGPGDELVSAPGRNRLMIAAVGIGIFSLVVYRYIKTKV